MKMRNLFSLLTVACALLSSSARADIINPTGMLLLGGAGGIATWQDTMLAAAGPIAAPNLNNIWTATAEQGDFDNGNVANDIRVVVQHVGNAAVLTDTIFNVTPGQLVLGVFFDVVAHGNDRDRLSIGYAPTPNVRGASTIRAVFEHVQAGQQPMIVPEPSGFLLVALGALAIRAAAKGRNHA